MSAAEFITRLFGELPELFKDEDELRALWSRPETRKALLESLQEKGYGGEQLGKIRRMIDAVNSDLYDVLAYIVFALSPISRIERVETRKAWIFSRYSEDEKFQAFLDFVLVQYVRQDVSELDQDKLPDPLELKYHSVGDAAAQLDGVDKIREAFVGFQRYLYEP
jgi:type I restriction enzyme R subunit